MHRLKTRFQNLTLIWKLVLLSMLFAIPIGLLAQLFVSQSLKDIRFAEGESEGIAVLRAVWPAFVAATAPEAASAGGLDENRARLAGLEGPAVDPDARAAALDALSGGDPAAATAALRALIARISDRSKLTLDPDLDSYYVMDAVVFKLPEVVDAAAALAAVRRDGGAEPALARALAGQRLSVAGAALRASVAAAVDGNADGRLRETLVAPAAALAAALDAYAAAPPTAAAAARGDLDRAVGALWEVATGELSRLLVARADGFRARLWEHLTIAGAVTLVIFALVGLVSRDITRSIDRVVDRMTRLAEGDLSAEVPFADRRNELGRIARSVIVFRDALDRVARLRAEREADERRAADTRRSDVRRLAAAFEESVGGIARTVASAAMRLEASAGALTEASASAASRSAETAGAVEETAARLVVVSASTGELSTSVEDIARRTRDQAEIAARAAAESEAAAARMAALVETARDVRGIVEAIEGIAEQTNLLALNATIEAARAGEAGQGFTVVAGEVKQLAEQTARATDHITRLIAAIGEQTEAAAASVATIRGVVAEVGAIAAAIAGSVAQQGGAAREIAGNVAGATRETETVTRDVARIGRSATDGVEAAGEVLAAVRELVREAETLNTEVFQFLDSVRAA